MTLFPEFADTDSVELYDPSESTVLHNHEISDGYVDHIFKANPELCRAIGLTKMVSVNLLREADGEYEPVSMSSGFMGGLSSGYMVSMSGAGLTTYPTVLDSTAPNCLEENCDLLFGSYPKETADLVLPVVISTVLTVPGVHIPARMASGKDAVEALRSE